MIAVIGSAMLSNIIKLKIKYMVKSICHVDRSKDGVFYHIGKYKYRFVYEGQRWINLPRRDNFVCNLRIDYKDEGDKYYLTACRVHIDISNDDECLNVIKIYNIVLDAIRDELLNCPDILDDFI